MDVEVPLDVVLATLPLLTDEPLIDTELAWVRNGKRGVVHVNRNPGLSFSMVSQCRKFKVGSGVPQKFVAPVSQVVEQEGAVCTDCVSEALLYRAAQGGVPAGPLIDYARLRDVLSEQVASGISPLEAGLARDRVETGVHMVENLLERDLGERADVFARALLADLQGLRASLGQTLAEMAPQVHLLAVRTLMELAPYEAPEWAVTDQEAQVLGSTGFRLYDSVFPSVYAAWLEGAFTGADAAQLRDEAVDALLDVGLHSLDQLALVPAETVVAAVSQASESVLVQVPGDPVVLSGLSQAWRASARQVFTAMVDRWEARRLALVADDALVRVAVGVTDGEDVTLRTLIDSGVVLTVPGGEESTRRAVTCVSGAAAQLLERESDEQGSYWTNLAFGRVPDGVSDAALETALSLWDPWDPESSYAQFPDALAAGLALMLDAGVPARQVRLAQRPTGRAAARGRRA